ncbi:MAG: flagellar biosynthesis protein FlhB [Gammaproteobacteria bacterium]|nr:flagellar biosynthesis protein FlhB [Gammaproteobacteria bacterium]
MAEEKDSDDRTEQPTAKRLDEARKKGQVPRSADLSAAAVSLAAVGAIYLFGTKAASELAEMMSRALSITSTDLMYPDIMIRHLVEDFRRAGLAILPILGATVVAALAAPAVIGGWNFSGEALSFKGSRLDPLKGIGRMFTLRSLVELLKALVKFLFVGGIGVMVISSRLEEIAHLASMPLGSAMGASVEILAFALLAMTGALGVIALIDGPFQMFQYTKELRMSREEVRDEFKEADGNPETKSRMRGLLARRGRGRQMKDVPSSTVIVTNPTHYAVALRYQEGRDAAPVVVAKGADEVAARIRELGTEHGVPIVSAPPLARVLFRHVEVGYEVPGVLYVALAQVLTYVYQLKAAIRYGTARPRPPVIDPAVEKIELAVGRS